MSEKTKSDTDTAPYEGGSSEAERINASPKHEVGKQLQHNIDFSTHDRIEFLPPMRQNQIKEITSARSKDEISTGKIAPRSNDLIGKLNPRTNVIKGRCVQLQSNDNNVVESSPLTSRKNSTKTKMSRKSHKKNDETRYTHEDEDTISIPTQSDLDDKINQLIQSEEDSESSSDDDLDILSFKLDYLDDADVGPSVDSNLADLFKSLKESGLSTDKVATKAKEHPRPENCNMETRKVNHEIWSSILNTKDRNLDLQLQKSQKLITKSSYAMLKIADSAIKAKKDKHKRKEVLKTIIKNATDAIAFAATAHKHNENLRRELMIKKLAYDQRAIAKDVPPEDKFLFGDNLSKRIKDSAGIGKLKMNKKFYPKRQESSTYRHSKNSYRPHKNPRGRHGGYSQSKNWKAKETRDNKN